MDLDLNLNQLDRACERVRDERQRTEEEQAAFEAFASRVAALDIQRSAAQNNSRQQATDTARAVTVSQPANPRLERVRDAYRETVMDTAVHRDEYDESVTESLAGEFSPELAAGIQETVQLTPQLHTALLNAAQQAQHERAILLELLADELSSLDNARDLHEEIATTLDELDAAAIETWATQSLEAALDRIQTLETECETLAQQRQELLQRRSNAPERELVDPSLCAYLYQEREFTYPVLATTSEAVERLQHWHSQLDRRLACAQ